MFDCSDEIICLSHYTYSFIIDTYEIKKEKINIIPNGLTDRRKYYLKTSNKNKELIKRHLSMFRNNKIILYIGRIDGIKGLEFLINAYKSLPPKIQEETKLIIVGDGDINAYIKLCNDAWLNIIFVGRQEEKMLEIFLHRADLIVLPYLYEQSSYVLIECMMFNKNIITTNAPGVDEMIEESDNCYKVKISEKGERVYLNTKELSTYIEKMISDDRFIIKSKTMSRFIYEKKYTYKCFEIKMTQFIKKLNVI